jgi:hypothetical protein
VKSVFFLTEIDFPWQSWISFLVYIVCNLLPSYPNVWNIPHSPAVFELSQCVHMWDGCLEILITSATQLCENLKSQNITDNISKSCSIRKITGLRCDIVSYEIFRRLRRTCCLYQQRRWRDRSWEYAVINYKGRMEQAEPRLEQIVVQGSKLFWRVCMGSYP